MRSVSVRLCDLENIKINLGYVGENEHVHILFDCKKAFDQYPNAVPSMVVVPPKGDSYPAVVTREGDIVEWVITDSDLIYAGNGKIQLQFQQGDIVMKSAEMRTFIAPSAIATGTIPTPIQNWIAQANAILAAIPDDINAALAEAQASGVFDGVGITSIEKTGTSGNVDTYTITLTDENSYEFTVTNGTPGQNGVGIQSIAKTGTSGLVDTYTITLTNNQTYTFTVTNGENGVQIDDVTPANNKVFSSAKVDEELNLLKSGIEQMQPAPETIGTAGQALVLDNELNPVWGDVNVDPEDIVEAVDDWLDDHPEATTTVQDGAITKAKLNDEVNNEINNKAPAIVEETTSKFAHKSVSNVLSVDLEGNSLAFGTAKIANRENLVQNETQSETSIADITYTKSGHFVKRNGLAAWGQDINFTWGENKKIPAGSYKFMVRDTKDRIASVNYKIMYRYTGETDNDFHTVSIPVEYGVANYDLTFTGEVDKFRVYFAIIQGVRYTDAVIWFGLYQSDATIIDTEQEIENGETYTYYGVGVYNFNVVDTMMHQSSLEYIVDTKSYIDAIDVDINNKLTYVTPERFGAKGDNLTNDTTAVKNCITYAIANNKDIYGAGRYRVTEQIKIQCDNKKIYFHELQSYPENAVDSLVLIEGARNHIVIDRIVCGNGIGVKICTEYGVDTINNYFQSECIIASGNALAFAGDTTNGEPGGNSYNVCMLNIVRSYNGNAISCDTYNGENKIYNAQIVCPSGWAFYNPMSLRCFGCSMESDVLNGIYIHTGNGGSFYGFRHIELVDKLVDRINGTRPSTQGGTLIKIVGRTPDLVYEGTTYIPYVAIDVSDMWDIDSQQYDNLTAENWLPAFSRLKSCNIHPSIRGPVVHGSMSTLNGSVLLGDGMTIIANKKICKPVYESTYKITSADFDMRDTASNNAKPYATRFEIDVADCVIHLASSYCCAGYNRIIVDQSDPDKLCTIYDDYDTSPIFDGDTLGAGVYELSAVYDMNDIDDTLDTYIGESHYTFRCYTGRNQKWIVKKLS